MANQPLLSIGMIVKNESRCLEKCLKALQPLRDAIPCELVIADTGSTDDTRDIAARYADILFDFPWINDFSAARNAVIGRCAGKWYLTVDADEYLKPDINEIVSFLRSSQADTTDFCTIIQRNFTKPSMQGIYSDFPATRMARLAISPRYHGAIHEHFPVTAKNRLKSLNNTVFDHDGYTALSTGHLKKKAERNLALLEKDLEKNPDDLRLILECLDSSATNVKKQRYYALMGMKRIMRDGAAALDTGSMGRYSATARRAVDYAVTHGFPEAEEWARWSLSAFPESLYAQVDVNFCLTRYLYRAERYDEVIQVGKAYFKGLDLYRKTDFTSWAMVSSMLSFAHPIREDEIRCMVGHALREEGRPREALGVLEKVNLTSTEDNVLQFWLKNMEKLAGEELAAEQAGNAVGSLLEMRGSKSGWERGQYKSCVEYITEAFAQVKDSDETPWKLYRNVPGTIGLCVKIMEAEDRAQAEALAARIEEWDEFMPSALDRLMTLGAELPDGFFRMKPERLQLLADALPKIGENAAAKALAYTEPGIITDLPRLVFAFSLAAAVLANRDMLRGEQGDALCRRFAELSAAYLSEFYSETLLADEEMIACLPALHRFAWYYCSAWEQEESGEYYKLLLKALRQSSDMRYLIEFLTERDKEKEKNRSAAASAQLLELAGKVRQLLAAYAPDDPAVAALKQTPLYQQVAHLIETPQDPV